MSKPLDQSAGPMSNADRVLGDWLQTARAHQAPPDLAAAIQRRVAERNAARVPADPIERIIAWVREQLWRPLALAALPLLLGLVAGWVIPENDDTATFAQTLDRLSFAEASGEQNDDTLR
jgi:hypothetical protein